MRQGCSSHEVGVGGRRIFRARKFAVSKKKGSKPSKMTANKVEDTLHSSEIDRSFKISAYPSAAEIFKLSELTDLSPNKIKAEFKRRREAYRTKNNLPGDALVRNSPFYAGYFLLLLPQMSALIFRSAAALCLSLVPFCLSAYSKIHRQGYSQRLHHPIK